MQERIKILIDSQSITAAKFAEVLGVQRSNVSHILSGRNKPSLDFIQKVLESYNQLNSDWLLFGKGEMYKSQQPNLFTPPKQARIESKESDATPQPPVNKKPSPAKVLPTVDDKTNLNLLSLPEGKKIERIIVFYTDKSFSAYSPE